MQSIARLELGGVALAAELAAGECLRDTVCMYSSTPDDDEPWELGIMDFDELAGRGPGDLD